MKLHSVLFVSLLLAGLPAAAVAGEPGAIAAPAPAEVATAAPAAEAPPAMDEMPTPTKTVPPVYPESARQRQQQGTVHVQARVARSGKVEKVRIVPGRGVAEDLDKAALDAVRQWEFKPARVKGQPKSAWVVIPIAFRLH